MNLHYKQYTFILRNYTMYTVHMYSVHVLCVQNRITRFRVNVISLLRQLWVHASK